MTNKHEDELLKDLETVGENLRGLSKCTQILDNDNFDEIYSMLYYLEEMPASVRKEIIEHLNCGFQNLVKYLQKSRLLT